MAEVLSDDYKEQHSPPRNTLQGTTCIISDELSPHLIVILTWAHSFAPLQKHRPVCLPQLPCSGKSPAHKHTNLPPKPRLSLTSGRRDVSNHFVPLPQLQATRAKAKQLASPSRFTCSQLVSSNKHTCPASSYIFGKKKKKSDHVFSGSRNLEEDRSSKSTSQRTHGKSYSLLLLGACWSRWSPTRAGCRQGSLPRQDEVQAGDVLLRDGSQAVAALAGGSRAASLHRPWPAAPRQGPAPRQEPRATTQLAPRAEPGSLGRAAPGATSKKIPGCKAPVQHSPAVRSGQGKQTQLEKQII